MDAVAKNYDRTALYYNLIKPLFALPYRRAASHVLGQITGIGSPARVLDIGTGTGLLAGAFAARGAEVTGVDISQGMLNKARQKYGRRISFYLAPAHAPGDYPDQSFHVVTSAFVLHGLDRDYRLQVLREMKRLAGELVAIVDFIPNFNPVVTLIERMEGSYYKEFLQEIEGQLDEVFPCYEVKRLMHFMGLYLCRVHEPGCRQ